MGTTRRILLTALPKWLISRSTGLLTRIPLPRSLRNSMFGWFSRRYGIATDEMVGEPKDYRSFAAFFQRPLKDGMRPIATDSAYVWPCDGKIITSGKVQDARIPQIKGRDYSLRQLLQDDVLAQQLANGWQATIYLAPGDYHRVHSPFDWQVDSVVHIPGKFFPVNPGAVDSIPDLFPRNERVVFAGKLRSGEPAAVVMVSALNVADTKVVCAPGPISRGAELGWFGFGSTVIMLTNNNSPEIPDLPRETRVLPAAALPTQTGS